MPNPVPERIAPFRCDVGEGPLWNPDSQLLLWLDIPPGILYSFDPRTGAIGWRSTGPPTGGITLQDDGSLLLFQDGRISVLEPDGQRREVRSGLCPGNDRFNDVIADPEGRVFAGAMGGVGRLFRFDPDGSVREILGGLGIPNGMGFSPDLRRFYFIDTVPHEIYVFDYDRFTGAISGQRVFARLRDEEGFPDGMTVDAGGYVWVAVWFGSRLKRFAPDGSLDREIYFPTPQISCPTFGGPDLCDIYVTSANSTAADFMMPPGFDGSVARGGDTFRVRVEGIRGRPEFRSRLRFPSR
jgi:sugar lactone lactonase YvrE